MSINLAYAEEHMAFLYEKEGFLHFGCRNPFCGHGDPCLTKPHGVAVLMLNKKHPEGEDTSARMRGFEKLHEDGVKRIKALVTEFNK